MTKPRFGRRLALILVKYLGRRSLTLGYAITFADLLLAPFTPSNTARSGGTIYPIIANLPPLYGSKPNDPSARKIGSYLMWVAITAACITSSMFLSALAPNLLALALVKKHRGDRHLLGHLVYRIPAAGRAADSDHAAAGLLVLPA
ncbi:anion permease [Enterobacter ludwigii]